MAARRSLAKGILDQVVDDVREVGRVGEDECLLEAPGPHGLVDFARGSLPTLNRALRDRREVDGDPRWRRSRRAGEREQVVHERLEAVELLLRFRGVLA